MGLKFQSHILYQLVYKRRNRTIMGLKLDEQGSSMKVCGRNRTIMGLKEKCTNVLVDFVLCVAIEPLWD